MAKKKKRARVNLSIDRLVWRKYKAYCAFYCKVPSYEVTEFMNTQVKNESKKSNNGRKG